MLKQVTDIEADQVEHLQSPFKAKDMNQATAASSVALSSKSETSSSASVKRLMIKNNLFLDIDSLSKNL